MMKKVMLQNSGIGSKGDGGKGKWKAGNRLFLGWNLRAIEAILGVNYRGSGSQE
jgi:hypothetical protein